MSGYIGDISPIYCVSRGVDTIFRGEKSEGRYFRKYCQNIDDISARGDISEIFWKNRLWWPNIGDISKINRRFFGNISPPSCNVIWGPRSRPFWSNSLDVIPMVIWRSNGYFGPNFIYFIHFCFHSSFALSLLQFLLRLLNYLIILRYVCLKL